MEGTDDRIETNRAMWDERVPLHVGSDFYDVASFRAGRTSLLPFEIDEVGDVSGRTLLHLQCHFGLDTLSWARLGATVTGLDFSPQAVEAATKLAAEIGAADRAGFVCADVYSAREAVGGRTFDIVYTGHGALCWLPDIERWADVVAASLNPGGFLYLAEFHPVHDIFDWEEVVVAHDYFHDPAGSVDETTGSYVDADAPTVHNTSHEWRHPMGEIISALASRGLKIEFLHERSFTLWQRFTALERRDDRTYDFPAGQPRLPLSYSLKASRPHGH